MIGNIADTFFSHSLLNFYMLCVFISLATSIYYVIIPLNKLRIEYGFSVRNKENENKKRNIINFLNGPEQNEKNLKKITKYFISEIIISILPLVAVISIRVYLGRPQNLEYNLTNIIILLVFFVLWLIYNISSSIRFRKTISKYIPSMQKFHEKINNPKVLFAMLNVTNASRGSIKKLSKMEIPEYIEHDELDFKAIRKQSENDEDKYEIDPEAIKENLSKISNRVANTMTNLAINAKKLTKVGMKLADEQINQYVGNKVESWTNQHDRWKSSLINIINVLSPIFVVYIFGIIW